MRPAGSKIKVIIKRPDEAIGHVTNISDTLENLQRTVGGYIETLTILRNPDLVIIMNEDGKLMNLPYNFKIPGDTIHGDVIVCGFDGEEFCDIPIDRKTWNSILLGWGN